MLTGKVHCSSLILFIMQYINSIMVLNEYTVFQSSLALIVPLQYTCSSRSDCIQACVKAGTYVTLSKEKIQRHYLAVFETLYIVPCAMVE